jgi:membrane-associated HD superfamily phosphohydrolase
MELWSRRVECAEIIHGLGCLWMVSYMVIFAMLVCQTKNRKQWRTTYLLLVHSLLAVLLVLLDMCEGFHLVELVCTITLGKEFLARLMVHHYILGSVRLEVMVMVTMGERIFVLCGESMAVVASTLDRRRNLKIVSRRDAAAPAVCVVWASWNWICVLGPSAKVTALSMW